MNEKDLHVLLVEDDTADAELTTRSLRKEKAAGKVVVARDGAEALDYLFCRGEFTGRDIKEIPQVVLLDLKLPRISGHDVLKAIKADERTRCIPVIVMTSSNHEEDVLECYRGGVNSYVQKPVSLSEFQEAVKQLGTYWLGINQPPPETAFQTR